MQSHVPVRPIKENSKTNSLKMRTRIECLVIVTKGIIQDFLESHYKEKFPRNSKCDNWLDKVLEMKKEREGYFFEYTIGFYSAYNPLPYQETKIILQLECYLMELVEASDKLDSMMLRNKSEVIHNERTPVLQHVCSEQYAVVRLKLQQLIHYLQRMKTRPLTIKELYSMYMIADKNQNQGNINLLPPTDVGIKLEKTIRKYLIKNKSIGLQDIVAEFDAAAASKLHSVDRKRSKVQENLQQRESSYVMIKVELEKEKVTTKMLKAETDRNKVEIKELREAYARSDAELSDCLSELHDKKVEAVSAESKRGFVARRGK